MAHPRLSLPRVLTAMITTALLSVICLLALSPAAFARVSIVPGTAGGGATETFAVRLANERSDVASTRLELTFPADVVIPTVEVAETDGWTATVQMRPLDPPVTVGDREVDETVASIVWEGGEVAPKRFEQFLVTAGPLPADGTLVFTAVQGYDDGSEERWTDPGAPGAAGAPTIVLVPQPAAAPAEQPADSDAAPADVPAPAAAPAAGPGAGGQNDLLMWVVLAGGGVLVVVAAVAAYRFVVGRRPTDAPEEVVPSVEPAPERAGRR